MSALTDAAISHRSRTRVSAIWHLLLLGGLFAGVALRVLGYELRLDEQLYIPPAELLGEQALYRDIFYNHVPYSAWYFHAIHLLTGGEHLVLAARLGIVLAWAGTIAAVWWAGLAISGSRLMALFAAVAVAANVYLHTVPGMTATNNFLQIGPAFGGLALFVLVVLGTRRRPLAAFMAGVCLSVAVGLKVSAFVLVPPLALAAFLLPRELRLSERLVTVTLPMAVGGLLAATPLFAALIADPERFVAHVAGYHTGPHIAYWDAMRETEAGLALGLGAKLRLAMEIWLQSTDLLLLTGAAILCALAVLGRGRVPVAALLVTLAVTGIAVAASFLPTPSFPQYFVLPLIGFLLLPPLIWRALAPAAQAAARPVLVALIAMMALLALPRLGETAARAVLGAPMTHQKVERAGAAIRAALDGRTGPVATLAPGYPLEAGLEVYPEFATGQFGYRVVPMAAEEDLEHYAIVGPGGVPALLDATPPAAILTGFAPALEAPFVDWAHARGYAPAENVAFADRYGRATLWLAPR